MGSLEDALVALRAGGAPDTFAAAALEAAEAPLAIGEGLRAIEILVAAERELAQRFGFARGRGAARHLERAGIHALLGLRERVDQMLGEARRRVGAPEALRQALELEVERGITLCRVFLELGWYAHAATTLAAAELPLDYLGLGPRQRFEWWRQRATWAFAAREIEQGRAAVRGYHALFRAGPVPEGELERLVDELAGWLEVGPVRALVADLGPRVAGQPVLEGRLLAWDVASTLFFPWDEALEQELERRLGAPTVPLLEALVDRVTDSLAARATMSPEQVPRPALVADAGRVLDLLDRLADLAQEAGETELAVRAQVAAHEQMLDVLATVRPDVLATLDPLDAARVREILAEEPWSPGARIARLSRLRELAGPRVSGRALVAIAADPMLPPPDVLEVARQELVGPPDEHRLDVAAALIDRAALEEAPRRAKEAEPVALARRWLGEAAQVSDPDVAAEAKEILASALELAGDHAGALGLFEELATYFEARDHERWVRAVERCAMLAKQTGRLSSAGRAARSGFRPGGRVQPPGTDLPEPATPLEAEEQAERAIAVAVRTTEPEVGEAWLRRALALYERVPDGRRREDEIWERIADLWQAEADALFETAGPSSEALDEAHRRAHEALVRAVEVNEDLGDGERVFELSGRVLDVLWTWLTRWEDALGAFLDLARGRFQSAIERGDLDHAAAGLFELRAHVRDFRRDAAESSLEAEEPARLLSRFEQLEGEMEATLGRESALRAEPWWAERLARRAVVLEGEDEDG